MIAREGLIFVFSGLTLTVLSIVAAAAWNNKALFFASLFFGILTLFCVFFFRDPQRTVAPGDLAIVSPADGKVLKIETLKDHPFVGENTIKISIFLSVMDVHINRVPVSGTVDYVKYNPGEFHLAYVDKASSDNEQTEIGMVASNGHKIVFKQIAGMVARRIVCYLKDGDKVTAGDRFGLIRFGSRAELFLPEGSLINIKEGEHVKGAETLIGTLPK